ncbi:hypothetical protein STEG23_036791 [Scotinomys teguina]
METRLHGKIQQNSPKYLPIVTFEKSLIQISLSMFRSMDRSTDLDIQELKVRGPAAAALAFRSAALASRALPAASRASLE